MPDPTTPRPDVPDEIVDDAVDAWHNAPRDEHGNRPMLDDLMRHILTAVTPGIERQVREKVAADLKRAAAGRRDYATRASEPIAADLEAEARVLDTAARVATEPREVMWGLLPADMWADADLPAEAISRRIARGEAR